MTDFTSIYRKYAPDVYRFALYLSGDSAEADDITSETFVRAWASAERIEMATVKAYLFTIARNLFLQGHRKKSRNVELDGNLRDRRATPEILTAQKNELQHVVEGLQQLSEIDRAALLMRALDNLPYEEIARVLEISTSSAKVKVHRARLALAGLRAGSITGSQKG
jgi:RNA polymerase sigma-70 factor (ECF subfamily)